jgi:hypothetical protein
MGRQSRLKALRQRRAKVMKSYMKSAVKTRRRPGVFYSRTKPSNKQPLRNLVQPAYPHITTWSEAKCKAYMLGKGVFPRAGQLTTQRCWKCGHKLSSHSPRVTKAMKSKKLSRKVKKSKPKKSKVVTGAALRCTRRSCRIRVYRPEIAYTPLWASASGGNNPLSYRGLLRMSYCVGLKTPQDSARHLTELGYKQTQRVDRAITVALAFAECQASDEVVFDAGEVDVDSGASGISRGLRSTVFKGRIGVFKDRTTKKVATLPLGPKKAIHGKRNLGPETKEEMKKGYKRMRDGSIHMSDGGPGLIASAKDAKLPCAHVVHGRQEYVRPVKFKKSELSPATLAAVRKRPAANSKHFYHTLAGDNAAEGWLGNLTRLRSRQNKHGGRATSQALLNQLAASYLNREAGLDRVIDALAAYRKYAQNHIAPAAAFGVKLDAPWLPRAAMQKPVKTMKQCPAQKAMKAMKAKRA